MTTLWKLTTQARQTYNELRWEPGVWQPPLPGAAARASKDVLANAIAWARAVAP